MKTISFVLRWPIWYFPPNYCAVTLCNIKLVSDFTIKYIEGIEVHENIFYWVVCILLLYNTKYGIIVIRSVGWTGFFFLSFYKKRPTDWGVLFIFRNRNLCTLDKFAESKLISFFCYRICTRMKIWSSKLLLTYNFFHEITILLQQESNYADYQLIFHLKQKNNKIQVNRTIHQADIIVTDVLCIQHKTKCKTVDRKTHDNERKYPTKY